MRYGKALLSSMIIPTIETRWIAKPLILNTLSTSTAVRNWLMQQGTMLWMSGLAKMVEGSPKSWALSCSWLPLAHYPHHHQKRYHCSQTCPYSSFFEDLARFDGTTMRGEAHWPTLDSRKTTMAIMTECQCSMSHTFWAANQLPEEGAPRFSWD